jgi:hypothetical protein
VGSREEVLRFRNRSRKNVGFEWKKFLKG